MILHSIARTEAKGLDEKCAQGDVETPEPPASLLILIIPASGSTLLGFHSNGADLAAMNPENPCQRGRQPAGWVLYRRYLIQLVGPGGNYIQPWILL